MLSQKIDIFKRGTKNVIITFFRGVDVDCQTHDC